MDSNNMPSLSLDDRRDALRQKCRVDTLQVEHAGTGIVTAYLLDISRQGFKLLMPLSVPCGAEVIIHPPDGMDLLQVSATVVRQSLTTRNGQTWIDCGVKVAESAAWQKHIWFLTLRLPHCEEPIFPRLEIVPDAA